MSGDNAFSHGASGSNPSTRHLGGKCRVCGGSICADEPALLRPWALGMAHVACGWLRPEERAPNEFRYPERWGTYWQWACPCCARDVVREERRAELRCGPCEREGKTAPGYTIPGPAPARKVVTFDIPDDADRGHCRSCGERVAWLITAKGKRMPVELATRQSHFARCPEANGWRKPKTTRQQTTK